jgi:hypothetical protein
MSATILSWRRSRNGSATACLILAQLSFLGCERDRPGASSAQESAPSLSSTSAADTADTLARAVGASGRATGPSYQVQMGVRQSAEKLGTTFDVTYQARLESGPDGELQGSGSYSGKELTWKVACSDLHTDPQAKERSVSGKLKASGSAMDMGSGTVLMFTLETLDFPPPLGWSGEVDEEVKGRGTVGNLGLTLTGPVTTKTVTGEGDLMGFSSETPCTGKFSNTQETTVEVVR